MSPLANSGLFLLTFPLFVLASDVNIHMVPLRWRRVKSSMM